MSGKNKKKSRNQKNSTPTKLEVILLITAIIELLTGLLDFIKHLLE